MKKFFAFLLTFAMLFSLAMPAMAAEGTKTIYFDNTDGWEIVRAYAWIDNTNNRPLGEWPGTEMTLVDGETSIYSIEVPADAVNIIFNNSSGTAQTPDQTIPTDGKNLYTFSTNTWSVYGEGGSANDTSKDVTATFDPTIEITDVKLTGDAVSYDANTDTYTVTVPAGETLVPVTIVVSGKDLEYATDADPNNLVLFGSVYPLGECINTNFTQNNDGTWTWVNFPVDNDTFSPSNIGYTNLGDFSDSVYHTVNIVQAYAITNTTTDTNGTITVPAEAAVGSTVTVSVNPNEGYELDTLTVTDTDGTPVTVENNQFTMPAKNVTVSATFKEAVKTYNVTIADGITNGTVTVGLSTFTAGASVTLAVNPAEGYELDTLTVTIDGTGEEVTVTDNSFSMPEANVTVTATFKKITYNVNIADGITGGTVSVDKATAAEGETVTVTITPAEGYTLTDIYGFNAEVDDEIIFEKVNDKTYTFTMLGDNVIVVVEFCLPGTELDTIYYKGPWTNILFEFSNSVGTSAGPAEATIVESGIYATTSIPEWSYMLYIRNLDDESQFINPGDIPTDGRNMYNAVTGEWETYTPSIPEVTSAEIVWGSMSFTYDDTIDEASGEERGWTVADEEGAGTVTVKNTGNTAISASAVYTPVEGYDEITGTLGEAKTLAATEDGTFTLTLSGKPDKAIPAGTKIGTVTVTIEEYDPVYLNISFGSLVMNSNREIGHSRHTV